MTGKVITFFVAFVIGRVWYFCGLQEINFKFNVLATTNYKLLVISSKLSNISFWMMEKLLALL